MCPYQLLLLTCHMWRRSYNSIPLTRNRSLHMLAQLLLSHGVEQRSSKLLSSAGSVCLAGISGWRAGRPLACFVSGTAGWRSPCCILPRGTARRRLIVAYNFYTHCRQIRTKQSNCNCFASVIKCLWPHHDHSSTGQNIRVSRISLTFMLVQSRSFKGLFVMIQNACHENRNKFQHRHPKKGHSRSKLQGNPLQPSLPGQPSAYCNPTRCHTRHRSWP